MLLVLCATAHCRDDDPERCGGDVAVNGTFDDIWDCIASHGRRGIVFGVTGAGVCKLLGYERICPLGRDA